MEVSKNIKLSNLGSICSFFQSEEELAYTFPSADYPLTEAQLKKVLKDRKDYTAIINNNNEILAFATVYNIEDNYQCYLGNLVTNPKYRRMGIGKKIVEVIIDIASFKYKVKYIKLNCWENNKKGVQFYIKAGFTHTKTIKKVIKNREITVFQFSKYIS